MNQEVFEQQFLAIFPDLAHLERDEKIKHLREYYAEQQQTMELKMIEYKKTVQENYVPLHKQLYDFGETFTETYFVPSFVEAIKAGTPTALSSILYKQSEGIYTFNMLTPQYCKELLEEVDHFEKWALSHDMEVHRPNSMNNYGAILDNFGFEQVLQDWMKKLVQPFAVMLYPEFGAQSLDEHHGFVVEYKLGKDIDLGFHVDDSEITLNVCLGKIFEGGTLYFKGVRCPVHQSTATRSKAEEFVLTHKLGTAVLHVGKHRHGANPILDGERFNLILWCRSTSYRKTNARDVHHWWCGWR